MEPQELFEISEEEQEFRKVVEDFTKEQLHRIASQALERTTFSRELFWEAYTLMRESGLVGIGIPEEYGGQGGTDRFWVALTEEVCSLDPATPLSLGATFSLVAAPILAFGTDEQKAEWLPKIASGDIIGCYAQTEPDAGSDVAGITTKASQGEDGTWRITGTKHFITNGSEANVALVFAVTDPEAQDPHKGMTMFIVDCDAAKQNGTLVADRNEHKAGLHQSPTTEMTFDNCEAQGILGELHGGWKVAMATLGGSRATVIPAQAVGIIRGSLNHARAYAEQRDQFGKPIATFPRIAQMLNVMEAKYQMAHLVTRRAALLKEATEAAQGLGDSRPYELEASVAKLLAAEYAVEASSMAVQVLGGSGYIMESWVPKLWHDSHITTIYEGTSEIQEAVIVRNVVQRGGLALLLQVANKETEEIGDVVSEFITSWPFWSDEEASRAFAELLDVSEEDDTFVLDLLEARSMLLILCVEASAALQEVVARGEKALPVVWHEIARAYAVLDGASLVYWRWRWQKDHTEATGAPSREAVAEAVRLAVMAVANAASLLDEKER